MTDKEIKLALKEREEQFQLACKEHHDKLAAIQARCGHDITSYKHHYLHDWEEHYFTRTCNICGESYNVEPSDKEFDTLWDKYLDGEIN